MIDIHRYYELKHFCLQYYAFLSKTLSNTDDKNSSIDPKVVTSIDIRSRSPENLVETRDFYRKRIAMIETTAKKIGQDHWQELFVSVTLGVNYKYLCKEFNTMLTEDEFKQMYLDFFNELDKIRK